MVSQEERKNYSVLGKCRSTSVAVYIINEREVSCRDQWGDQYMHLQTVSSPV